ncbi:Cof-type HAD-IIB family hydrolase [Furfurilactobacillus curtus]|uniref:Cof-type HAD-IIB family hydrolase n=1 Tax=Furfurilactobacillus curtus TaxID=1746200 RepID=UPI0038B2F692
MTILIKLIASDLDETLLDTDGTLSAKNIQAIKEATAAGVYFVPNSGRGYESFEDNLQALGLAQQPGQYKISFNGAAILENAGDRVLATNAIPFAIAKGVFDAGRTFDQVSCHAYTLNQLYIYHQTPTDAAYMASRSVPFTRLNEPDLNFLASEPIMKVIFETPDVARQHELADFVMARYGDDVDVTFSSGRYIEFNRKGINKGRALLQLAELLQLDQSETMAVGDNFNDLSMIQAAGVGVAVANAVPAVAAAANLVTRATNDQAAMAEIIQEHVLPGYRHG